MCVARLLGLRAGNFQHTPHDGVHPLYDELTSGKLSDRRGMRTFVVTTGEMSKNAPVTVSTRVHSHFRWNVPTRRSGCGTEWEMREWEIVCGVENFYMLHSD